MPHSRSMSANVTPGTNLCSMQINFISLHFVPFISCTVNIDLQFPGRYRGRGMARRVLHLTVHG